MRIECLGGDDPELAVVGGIHGDEPCGINAVERVLDDPPELDRPVKFIVANEEAIAAGERYLEEDLNRAFPGDPDGPTHESRLAARLTEELDGCLVFSMHSTQSYDGTFALIHEPDARVRPVLKHLSVDAVVDVGSHSDGRLFDAVPTTIEVECGYQGSDQATENASRLLREFLGATGALPQERTPEADSVPLFRLDRQIPKDEASSYAVYASNFEQVAEGEPFAAADDREVTADEPFYPVLMSPYGYETVFGYTAQRLGTVEEFDQLAE
ncbi:succinylglutamate desuccinylase [Halovenus sp. WSH3]|uniref:Succinylglutamate desuccinylase n=1 Tax=Halovenus carboxidivorans TaxID=2692199 RepID=A0A6B0T7U0_9EURY|nr:succinylglutamate desuccinylase/aspartoacylase family protein [Halovenus carboxidivorans]MXR51261.1 succinylglutamate desuccinylase [Halovenus carboxidivorans]